jgi:two-component system sensor histidine kinase/response regulator
MREMIRVLLIEDNPGDARLIREFLNEAEGFVYELTWADQLNKGIELLKEEGADVVLLDLSMPDSRADETLSRLREIARSLPVIINTGLHDEEAAAQAARGGAQDYLVKGRYGPETLVRSIRYAIERNRMEVELRELNRDLSAFAHTLSHDLRAPLGNAYGYLMLLRERCEKEFDSEEQDWCNTVVKSLERMDGLIKAMLEYTRADREVAPAREADLAEMIGTILEELEETGALQGVEIAVERELPTVVPVFPVRLRQVLTNLISNAARFMGGNPRPRICIGTREVNGEPAMYIEDNGMGIRREEWEKVFEPLGRSDDACEIPGHGLGLAICKRAVESWGGRIWVESEPGQGSTFFFTLPKMGIE